MSANLAISETHADDSGVGADIPRTPGIACPATNTVLSSPSIGRNGEPVSFETMAMRQPITESQFPTGEASIHTCGFLFFAMGRIDEKAFFAEAATELGKHAASHLFGPLGSAAMAWFQTKREVKRSLESPDSFAIPAPAITAIHYGSLESLARPCLVVTCEDDEGGKGNYTFVPKSTALDTAANFLWTMRFWFELGVSHLDLVSRVVPEAALRQVMSAYYDAWFKTPGDFDATKRHLQSALSGFGDSFPAPEVWNAGRGQAFYHLQKFKQVKFLRERYAVEWKVVESLDAFCFGCAEINPPRSQQCRACGKALY